MSLICRRLNNGVFHFNPWSSFYVSPNGRCLNKQLDLTWCWCEECTELVALLVHISWFPCLQLDLMFEIVLYHFKWLQAYFILCSVHFYFYIRLLITYSQLTCSHLHSWVIITSMDICVSARMTPPVNIRILPECFVHPQISC